MDDVVLAAMRKWPHVPACAGWLGLDARGRWWMRNAAAQAAGPFAGPGSSAASKGEEVRHDKLCAFIARNYTHNGQGAWYFQNGPQRVYVELEHCPWVWRLDAGPSVCSHTGQMAQPQQAWLDEAGRLYLQCDLGLGVVHSQDMVHAIDRIDSGQWQPRSMAWADMPAYFGFLRSCTHL